MYIIYRVIVIGSYIFIYISEYSSYFLLRHMDRVLINTRSKQRCNRNVDYLEPRFLSYIYSFGESMCGACHGVCGEARCQPPGYSSLFHVGSRYQIHVVRLGGQCLDLSSHLSSS